MNLQNHKVKIALGLLLAVCVIIGYRIYSNIQADKARAAKLSQVRNVAVVTAHPVRQTIVPSLSFPAVWTRNGRQRLPLRWTDAWKRFMSVRVTV